MSFSFKPIVEFIPGHSTAPLPSSIAVRFGERLRSLRLAHGYTQIQLAGLLGIDRSFIGNIERGSTTISLSYLETIAQGFDLTLSELTEDL